MAQRMASLLLSMMLLACFITASLSSAQVPWKSISTQLHGFNSDHCFVCVDDHCNSLSPTEFTLPYHGAAYFSFCCEQGLGGWCNSSFSFESLNGTSSSYLYYIWNLTNAQTCPPLINLYGNVDCIPRNFTSPPYKVDDVIAVPQGSCYAASILCLGNVENLNQSCVTRFKYGPSLLSADYCHLEQAKEVTASLPQCSGASICMNGNCEMCPTGSMTNWNPCQCTATNGTVYLCLPCQGVTAKKVVLTKGQPSPMLPTCTNSFACIEDYIPPQCYMCPPYLTISTTFNLAFTCSPYGQPTPCQLDAAHGNATGPPWGWQWGSDSPYRLGAGSQQCFINTANNYSLPPPDFGRIEIKPYILNDDLQFFAGYVPNDATDCSELVTIGTLTCNQDGYCGPYLVPDVGFPMPQYSRAALLIECTNLIETCSAELLIWLYNLSPM